MSSRPDVRRLTVELPLIKGRGESVWVEGKPLVRWWPLLHALGRGVLLPPQGAGSDSKVTWSWTEPATSAAPDSAALAGVRKRLREAAVAARDSGDETGVPSGVVDAFSRMVEALAARSDSDLARFVGATSHGFMVHSWGSQRAGAPQAAAAEDFDVAGSVVVMGRADAGHLVVLEDTRGHSLGKVRSDATGRFRFTGIQPGKYRVRGLSERVDFPVTGLLVEIVASSIENLELKSSASVAARSNPSLKDPVLAPATDSMDGTAASASPASPVRSQWGNGRQRMTVALGLVTAVGLLLWWLRREQPSKGGEELGRLGGSAPREEGRASPAGYAKDLAENVSDNRRPLSGQPSERGTLSRTSAPAPTETEAKSALGAEGAAERETAAKVQSAPLGPRAAEEMPSGASFQSKQALPPAGHSSLPGMSAGGRESSAPPVGGGGLGSPAGTPNSASSSPGQGGDSQRAAGAGLPGVPSSSQARPMGPSPTPAAPLAPVPPPAAPAAPTATRSAAAGDSPPESLPPAPSAQPAVAKPPGDEGTQRDTPTQTVSTSPSTSEPAAARSGETRGKESAPAHDTHSRPAPTHRRSAQAEPDSLEASQGLAPSQAATAGPPEISGPTADKSLPVPLDHERRIQLGSGQWVRVRDEIVATVPVPVDPKAPRSRGLTTTREEGLGRPPDWMATLVSWSGVAVESPRAGAWEMESIPDGSISRVGTDVVAWRGDTPRTGTLSWRTDRGVDVRVRIDSRGELEISWAEGVRVALWMGTPKSDDARLRLRGSAAGQEPLPELDTLRWMRLDRFQIPITNWEGAGSADSPWIAVVFSVTELAERGERVALVDDRSGWARVIPVSVAR